MFIELTTRDDIGVLRKLLINTANIASIWEEDGVCPIFTIEDNNSFSVTEPYASIKFLLGMNKELS